MAGFSLSGAAAAIISVPVLVDAMLEPLPPLSHSILSLFVPTLPSRQDTSHSLRHA